MKKTVIEPERVIEVVTAIRMERVIEIEREVQRKREIEEKTEIERYIGRKEKHKDRQSKFVNCKQIANLQIPCKFGPKCSQSRGFISSPKKLW